ncbi:protein SLX4IP [Pristis pectinata]|uniref:protein SLX4IP n=1 Tax=Pristis pectinata TaxID=685728 RepID=UPI00223E658F|nr:protein SLX4IP [Pristis pectinata]XP_051868605.1 protein SLX4IP [Pristis pectinata]XP_051868606.1 protein SLX4IP [Pristis pectinata]XP_051868607.1 protein SLX4IP [Pristis pectinata]XP_051868608.1 protein SLX4IP [Pristis pectinata]
MPSNKFVLKCGNFAVLVDPHILPEGANKDTSWFTERHKEEISALLKENIDLRIKQYLEARKQHGNTQTKPNKELAPNNPLCIKGQNFHLAAYFMKRHANLRCVTKQQFCGLTIFPDRFVVCLTPCETGPKKRMAEEQIISSKHGASEYFTGESEMKEPCNVSISIQKKKEALKQIVKKSCCTKMENFNKADSSGFLTKALLGVTEDEQDVAPPAAGLSHEIQDINTGRREDYVNSVQSKLLPVIKLEKYINKRQPAQQNCQQQPQSIEQLKTGLKSTADDSESALQNLKQNEANKKVQTKRRRVSSQNGTNVAVKIISGETPATPVEVTMEMNSPESLRKPLKKKTLVKPNSHSKRSVKGKPDCLVLTDRDAGGYLFSTGSSPQDFCHVNTHKKRRLTVQNKLTRKSEVAPSSPSCSKSQNSATILIKDKSEKENLPRKSRLRRPKKAGTFRSDSVAM